VPASWPTELLHPAPWLVFNLATRTSYSLLARVCRLQPSPPSSHEFTSVARTTLRQQHNPPPTPNTENIALETTTPATTRARRIGGLVGTRGGNNVVLWEIQAGLGKSAQSCFSSAAKARVMVYTRNVMLTRSRDDRHRARPYKHLRRRTQMRLCLPLWRNFWLKT
jgi:hypothetical protein